MTTAFHINWHGCWWLLCLVILWSPILRFIPHGAHPLWNHEAIKVLINLRTCTWIIMSAIFLF
jgi:hypothetical protein